MPGGFKVSRPLIANTILFISISIYPKVKNDLQYGTAIAH
jgi:hypothetical protein